MNARVIKALARIEKKLESIEGALHGLDDRLSALESGKGLGIPSESPSIYSRVLMGTLDAIREYEKEHGQGVVARDLARIRNVELPTIYDHLSKLEAENLVMWQRGTEIGLKPFNAKFYSVAQRDELLSDLPVLMALPEKVIPIAQAIIKESKKGVTEDALVSIVRELKAKGDAQWREVPDSELEEEVDIALKLLLRRVLIRREREREHDRYFPIES